MRCADSFETYLGTSENFSFQPVVLHADLSRDHLITHNDAVAGVLDFGDVNWGDPDYDFHYLFLDFGEAFAIDVASIRSSRHRAPTQQASVFRLDRPDRDDP